MTWSPDKFASGREVDKCRDRLVKYCQGVGLDVGCGGLHADRHHDTENKITPLAIGVDLTKTNLVGRADKLYWFKDGVLDYIFSSHLLEHMFNIPNTLKEWLRVLKVGGHIVMYLPLHGHYPAVGEPGANADHKQDLTPNIMISYFAGNCPNVDIVHIEERIEGDEYSFDFVVRKKGETAQDANSS
jgi:predicted SAM-dependent methyltransferase